MQHSLTGLWQGQFTYPRNLNPEFFTANLLEGVDFLGGSIQETARSGRHAGKTFYASVSGQRSGNAVNFAKIYETPPMTHTVLYAGMLNGDATEIEGTWSVPNNWSGKFLMIRAGWLVQAAGKRVEEKV